jgi:hypothetical protein
VRNVGGQSPTENDGNQHRAEPDIARHLIHLPVDVAHHRRVDDDRQQGVEVEHNRGLRRRIGGKDGDQDQHLCTQGRYDHVDDRVLRIRNVLQRPHVVHLADDQREGSGSARTEGSHKAIRLHQFKRYDAIRKRAPKNSLMKPGE